MELRDCRFCFAGHDMNFAIFSDDPCCVRYRESIPLPIGHTRVEVYEIEPGAKTHWILVKQMDGDKNTLRVFIKSGEKFLESRAEDVSRETKKQIMRRFPKLTAEFPPPLAA